MNWLLPLLGGLVGGALLSSFMKNPAAPAQQTLLAPEAARPAPTMGGEKTPEYDKMLKSNRRGEQIGPSAGPSSTFLTGAQGVDPNKLRLGKSSLLGS